MAKTNIGKFIAQFGTDKLSFIEIANLLGNYHHWAGLSENSKLATLKIQLQEKDVKLCKKESKEND